MWNIKDGGSNNGVVYEISQTLDIVKIIKMQIKITFALST